MEILREAVAFGSFAVVAATSPVLGHLMSAGELGRRPLSGQPTLTSETYVFGQLARALMHHADGDAAEASDGASHAGLFSAWGTDSTG